MGKLFLDVTTVLECQYSVSGSTNLDVVGVDEFEHALSFFLGQWRFPLTGQPSLLCLLCLLCLLWNAGFTMRYGLFGCGSGLVSGAGLGGNGGGEGVGV